MTSAVTSPSSPAIEGARRRKWRAGTVALREIRKQQKSVKPVLPRAAFERLVREIMQESSSQSVRLQPEALDALQQGAEDHLVALLTKSQKLALHAGRVTITPNDFELASEAAAVDT